MKKKLSILLMMLFSAGLFAQGVYNNGVKIVIGPGTYFNISGPGGNYRNETNINDGSIILAGKLKLDGNYTNNVSGNDILTPDSGDGQVIFSGSSIQTLGGSTLVPFVFNNLKIDNPGGITLEKNVRVDHMLTLTSGLVDIGDHDFVFGLAGSVEGPPSAASMINATGSGLVEKEFSAPGNFTFPVGDNTGIADYSPVTLDITSGSFSPGAKAGVNLVNAKYPDPLITGSYLERYWNLEQSGISLFQCNAQFNYVAGDVTGDENIIACMRMVPAPVQTFDLANTITHQLSANGITLFGSFTGSQQLIPSLAGPSEVCLNSAGNIYSTEAGQVNYTWIVSPGGTITDGGTSADNTVTVLWNTAGPQTVSVNYSMSPAPAVKNVNVNMLPVPGLSGPTPVMAGSAGNTYSTEPGMVNYSWIVSPGGTVTSGGGPADNSVTVTWNSSGGQFVSVSYTDVNGCSASVPTQFDVTVEQASKTLNLKVCLEGYYTTGPDMMTKARNSDGETVWDNWPGTIVDTLSVLLVGDLGPVWPDPLPYAFEAHGRVLNTDGTIVITDIPAQLSGNYFIIIRHRQSVETWSALPVSFGNSLVSYDFTTSASQAFGNNQKILNEGSLYCLFAGDVTGVAGSQDGYVDIFDNVAVFNQSQAGAFGYILEDVTGDGFVDIFDMAMVFNNQQNGAGMITPPNPGKK